MIRTFLIKLFTIRSLFAADGETETQYKEPESDDISFVQVDNRSQAELGDARFSSFVGSGLREDTISKDEGSTEVVSARDKDEQNGPEKIHNWVHDLEQVVVSLPVYLPVAGTWIASQMAHLTGRLTRTIHSFLYKVLHILFWFRFFNTTFFMSMCKFLAGLGAQQRNSWQVDLQEN